jgi:ABC-type proline/glycine betaine transport system substrate-binding protein
VTKKMTESKEPSITSEMVEMKVTEAASSQTEHSVAASPTALSQDLDAGIRKATHQVQLIAFLTAHQRSIKYASHAIEEAIRGKRSNRMSGEDVARRWLYTAQEEIETWVQQTKQMIEEFEDTGSSGKEEKEVE